MHLDINSVHPDQDNVRRVPVNQADDDALVASMAEIGQLQPILVRENGGDGVIVVAGHRRLKAARKLGWEKIEAINTDSNPLAAQAAENMVRVGMEPLDQWRAIVAMQEQGYTLDHAAAALGLARRQARLLDKLGRLHPDVLALVERFGMPHDGALKDIAAATLDTQAKAARAKGIITGTKKDPSVSWWDLAQKCRAVRMPKSRALFDTEQSAVVFEEDLFAEPDSPEAWTTSDIAGFRKQQITAVQALVDAKVKAGERAAFGAPDDKTMRKLLFIQQVSLPATRPMPAIKGTRCAWYGVAQDGAATVAVYEDKAKKGVSRAGSTVADQEEPAERAALTIRGQQMVAEAKGVAIRDTLGAEEFEPCILAAALILALAADNVSVQGVPLGVEETGRFDDLPVAAHAVWDSVSSAVARIIIPPAPKVNPNSGSAADHVGVLIEADRHLPRFDTPEFLAEVTGEALRELCEVAKVPTGKVNDMRERLVGKLPDWLPPGAEFED